MDEITFKDKSVASVFNFLLKLVLFSVSTILFITEINQIELMLLVSLMFVALAVRLQSIFKGDYEFFIAGFLVILVGKVNPSLLPVLIFFILLITDSFRLKNISWLKEIICLYFLWVIATLIYSTPFQAYFEVAAVKKGASLSLLFPGDYIYLYKVISKSPPEVFKTLRVFISILLFAITTSVLSNSSNRREQFKRGILSGVIISVPLLISKVLINLPELGSFDLKNVNNFFWNRQGRWRGTFTDPNSFGIVALMLFPVLLIDTKKYCYKNFIRVFVILWGGLALYSGSRSYLLALFIYLAILTFKFLKNKSNFNRPIRNDKTINGVGYIRGKKILNSAKDNSLIYRLIAVSFAVVVFSSSALYIFFPYYEIYLPASIHRIIYKVSHSSIVGVFDTRVKFWKIAIALFWEQPILGIGIDRFRELMTPIAERNGESLNLWIDSANNFYLSLIIELGLFGFISFLFTLSRFSIKENADSSVYRITLLLFMCLLVMGSHIEFFEVKMVLSLILASGYKFQEQSFYFQFSKSSFKPSSNFVYTFSFILISAFFICLSKRNIEFGFYRWEHRGHGIYSRWSSPKSQLFIECNSSDEVEFSLAGFSRRIGIDDILIKTKDNLKFEVAKQGRNRYSFKAKCNSNNQNNYRNIVKVGFESRRGWIPMDTVSSSRDKKLARRSIDNRFIAFKVVSKTLNYPISAKG